MGVNPVRYKQCQSYMGAEPEYCVSRGWEKCYLCSNFSAVSHEEGLCALRRISCRVSYVVHRDDVVRRQMLRHVAVCPL